MPTYDYHCTACGHDFERFHAPTEKISKACPACRRRKVERRIGTGAGIIFKGSGFYETDYRSKSYESGKQAEQKDGSSKDGSTKGDKGSCSGNPKQCDGPCSQ